MADQTGITESFASPTDKAVVMSLGISERVSIVNVLMTQDRIEIRERQEATFKLTYYVIPGLITIAVSFIARPTLRWLLVASESLLLVLYVVTFLQFRRWLADARACLRIREEFYQNQELLSRPSFRPLRPMEPTDGVGNIEDTHLWYPFALAVLTGVITCAYIVLG